MRRLTGWGECVAGEDPFYSSEWIEPAWSTIKHYLAPAVLGRTVTAAHESAGLMARVRGHRMAKAAIENALWDAEAHSEATASVEAARRHDARDSVRRLDRHSGFG